MRLYIEIVDYIEELLKCMDTITLMIHMIYTLDDKETIYLGVILSKSNSNVLMFNV